MEIHLLVFVTLTFVNTEAARILAMMPTPARSHSAVFSSITEELAKRGHEVVVITAYSIFEDGKTPDNLTEINVFNISFPIIQEHFTLKDKGNRDSFIAQLINFPQAYAVLVEKLLKSESVQKLLQDKDQRFDLIITEAYIQPSLVLSHFYNAPVILISSVVLDFINLETMGAPSHPLLYPGLLIKGSNNLSWGEKILELKKHFSIVNLLTYSEKLARLAGTPAVSELRNNVQLLCVNTHPVYQGNYPLPPSIVYMGGGLHLKPEKELPQDLKSYLDSSKNGVIFMSFGTSMDPSLLPSDKVEMFVRVLSQLPYDVLLKWDKDELPGRSENIQIGKFYPQADLLRHPKVKLFITQGGMQSTDEAIAAGVPLLGIPMLGDQWRNVEKYVQFKIGVALDFTTIDEQLFKDAIYTVLGDDSYRRNIMAMNDLYHSQRQRPLERAIWWTEHVLRHGGAHLRPRSANIPYWEYFMLDVVSMLLLTTTVCLVFLYLVALYLVRLLCRRSCNNIDLNNNILSFERASKYMLASAPCTPSKGPGLNCP